MQMPAMEAAKALLCDTLKISDEEFDSGEINFAEVIRETPLLCARQAGTTLYKQLCLTDYAITRCGGRASKQLMQDFMSSCSTILTSEHFCMPALQFAAACFFVHYHRNPAHE